MNYTITLTHAELCTLQDLLGDWSEYQDITGNEPAPDATRETIKGVMDKLMTAEREVLYAKVYHKYINVGVDKLKLTEYDFYNLAWDYAIENTPGVGAGESFYQKAQELVDRIYTEASKDRFNCGDYSLFIREDTDDLSDIDRPNY